MSIIKVKSRGTDNVSGRRNLLINGSMAVAQRGTSHSSATSYTLDRWNISQTTDGAVTITQDSSVPTGSGLANSYKLDVTTADTSLSSAQRVFPHQIIEAQNCQVLQYGTSEAKPITLSFYVKSNVTGTYTVLFYNSDASKHQSATYTIDSANTWEQKKITIQGDTASGFNNDNGAGLEISWWLAAGSNFTSGTLGTGSWQSETAANKVSSSNVNIMSSTDNEWFLTGCQLEVGDSASDFEHRSVGEELQLCQRYFQVPLLGNRVDVHREAGTSAGHYISFLNEMRATPTLTLTRNSTVFGNVNTGAGSDGLDSVNTNSKGTLLVIYTNGLPVQVGAECTIKAAAEL